MTVTPLVRVRGLTKTYGDRAAVDALDLDVRAGEIVGLLGANGAGKTTTVECILGLRRPDSGSVDVLGLDPAVDGDRVRRLVGSQQQESALPDRMRVGEAIALFRGPRAATVDGCWRRSASRTSGAHRSPPCPAGSGSGSFSCWRC